jgi:leucyl aminopeptidase
MIKHIHSQKIELNQSSSCILPFYEGEINNALFEKLSGQRVPSFFKAEEKDVYYLNGPDEAPQWILLGLGKSEKGAEYKIFRSFVSKNKNKLSKEICFYMSHLSSDVAMELGIAIALAGYSPGRWKTDSDSSADHKEFEYFLYHQNPQAGNMMEMGIITGEAMSTCMDLVDTPPNIKTPYYLADAAEAIAKSTGMKVRSIKGDDLLDEKLFAVYEVGKGSDNPPAFIEIEYIPESKDESTPKMVFVGKGISFDTGGISIKASSNMHFMKSDMGGAAAVIGGIELISRLRLPIHVVAIIPTAENMPDGKSYRPGDVIRSYSGKTIEIIDTDAEGRVVLADGLAWAIEKHQPDYLLDLATLTGSSVATLGYHAAALFCNNEELAEMITMAGDEVHNRVWPLPLWDDYADALHSDVADVKNFSGKPIAGAITAAKFLQVFTNKHPAWAHLDIAGVSFGDHEYTKMRSATGYGVRLLSALAMKIIEK